MSEREVSPYGTTIPIGLRERGKALEAACVSSSPVSFRNRDDTELMRLGKRPVLKRGFGFMSVLGFSCTVLITWEGTLETCTSALLNGGSAGAVWGFLICWIGTLSTFVTIAELASMAPISSGQFHWISILAPPSSKKFLSYITAWVTVIGWQAVNISNAFLCGSMLVGTVAMTHTSYAPRPWQTLLVTWAVLVFAVVVNSTSSRALARFESVILVVHILGFFGVMIPLVYFAPHGDASVLTRLYNGGGWSSDGLSFVVGMPSLIFSIFGADSAVHMSEEIRNAAVAVPRALILSVVINGALGFAMLIALVFCMGSLSAALDVSGNVGFAYIEIFRQAVRSAGGAAAMSAVVIALGIFGTVGSVAATTRLMWAFARDRGLPFSSALAKIEPRSSLPLNSIITTVTAAVLLSLISLGSSVALNDILSLSIAGLYSSYLICCAALLYRRLRGEVRTVDNDLVITGPDNLRWGPWRVREPFGTINNAFACVYLVWMLFWSFWPPYANPTPMTMNFSVVVFGAVVIFSLVWYVARARHHYHGPVIEIE